MDFLKALFETGALTFEAFVAAVNAAGIKLVNLADGGYVAKEKFDGKVTELTTAQTSLAEANKAIEGFKSLDVEGIKKQVDEWKDKYEKAEEAGKKTAYDMQVKALVEKEKLLFQRGKESIPCRPSGTELQVRWRDTPRVCRLQKAVRRIRP